VLWNFNVLKNPSPRPSLNLRTLSLMAVTLTITPQRRVVSMGTLTTIVIAVKQWAQLCESLLHKYEFNCRTRMVWLPWLPVLTLHGPTLTGASFASISEI
jgi:hypothetical protein